MKVEQQYIEVFSQNRVIIDAHSAEPLNAPREKALADFMAQGFPTKKVEKYKYTNVSDLFAPDYGLNLNRLDIPVNPANVFRCDVPEIQSSLHFVLNDAFHAGKESNFPAGVLFGSLKELSVSHPEVVKPYYATLAKTEKDPLVAFNTLFAQDGVLLYVPKNTVIEQPIQLINLLRSHVDLMVNRRILIVLDKGAQAKMLICDHALDCVNFLSTQVIEIFAGEDAVFDLYELEETSEKTTRFSNIYVKQERGSNVLLNGMTLHNGTTRNMTEVALDGEGAETHLYGVAIADKQEHVDNHTVIQHNAAHCNSTELYKYVLDDEATGAFSGMIYVKQGAQKTASEQTSRALCLTKKARIYTQPQLEIYADDVKCSHGATVGQLDENAVFYMQQRGISQREAKLLLTFAFVNEVIDNLRLDPLKERLSQLVEKRFRGEMGRCKGCAIH